MKRQTTNFSLGFATKGFNATEVGIDVRDIFKSPESWNADDDGEKEVGTPVQVDLTEDFQLKVCPDGEIPDGFLRLFVGDKYPGEEDFYTQQRVNKFVTPGDPVPFVVKRPWGVLDTKLLHEDYTNPSKQDEIYVEGGKFTDTDPTGDSSGEVIGTVYDVKEIKGDTFVVIVLNENTR